MILLWVARCGRIRITYLLRRHFNLIMHGGILECLELSRNELIGWRNGWLCLVGLPTQGVWMLIQLLYGVVVATALVFEELGCW